MLSSHLYLGLPCDLLVRGFQLNIFLTVLVSGISVVYYYIEIIITCFIQIRHLENSIYAIKHLISNCNNQNTRMLSQHQEGERCTSYKTSSSNNIYLQKADASVRTHINQGSLFFIFPTLLDSYHERTASLTYRRPSREKVKFLHQLTVFVLKSNATP